MDNIPLKNFTHYDTDDLQKLVNHVAAAVAELTQEAAVLRSGVQRIEFFEYTPASADQVVKTWNMHKNEYDEQLVRKFVGPEVRTRPERIALLAPKLIWKNPLEALISSTDGEESVPANMLENISRAVISVFNFSIWQHTREGRGMNLRLDEHRVRVRKTVGAKVGGDDKKREKLRLARRAGVDASYHLGSSIPALDGCIREMTRMQKYAGDPEMMGHIEAAQTALSTLFDLRAELVVMLKSVQDRRAALGDTSEVDNG